MSQTAMALSLGAITFLLVITSYSIHYTKLYDLGKSADVLCPFGDLHGAGLPEAERVDRPRRPVATGLAMAVTHGVRGAGYLEFDSAAEAAAVVGLGGTHVV